MPRRSPKSERGRVSKAPMGNRIGAMGSENPLVWFQDPFAPIPLPLGALLREESQIRRGDGKVENPRRAQMPRFELSCFV